MENRKYELMDEVYKHSRNGMVTDIFQIRALRDIPEHGVKKGDLGGYVEGEHNLSQEGSCWIADKAEVCEQARVEEDAYVGGQAVVWDDAVIRGQAVVEGHSSVVFFAIVEDQAMVTDGL